LPGRHSAEALSVISFAGGGPAHADPSSGSPDGGCPSLFWRGLPILPAPPPVLPAGASRCSAVLPEMVRLPPAARVIWTRRARAFGDAGIVTSRAPSALPAVRFSESAPSPREQLPGERPRRPLGGNDRSPWP
jgi:hypothetical protein